METFGNQQDLDDVVKYVTEVYIKKNFLKIFSCL